MKVATGNCRFASSRKNSVKPISASVLLQHLRDLRELRNAVDWKIHFVQGAYPGRTCPTVQHGNLTFHQVAPDGVFLGGVGDVAVLVGLS
jgi:hypothetical protein